MITVAAAQSQHPHSPAAAMAAAQAAHAHAALHAVNNSRGGSLAKSPRASQQVTMSPLLMAQSVQADADIEKVHAEAMRKRRMSHKARIFDHKGGTDRE